jgi:hypothetical protein
MLLQKFSDVISLRTSCILVLVVKGGSNILGVRPIAQALHDAVRVGHSTVVFEACLPLN